MALEAGGEIRLKPRTIEGAEEREGNAVEAYLPDGQQRLTSSYQSLRHEGPVDTHDNRGRRIKRWYYIDMLAAMDPNADRVDAIVSLPKDKGETRNFGREVPRDLSSRELEYEQHIMPTERLLDNGLSWLFGYVGHWNCRDDEHPDGGGFTFYERFNQSVMSRFSEYNLPVISLDKGTTKEAVCTVFEKVNTGGVTLSMFELVTASFTAQDENLSLTEDWDSRRSRLHSAFGVLQGIGGDQFLHVIALLTTSSSSSSRASRCSRCSSKPFLTPTSLTPGSSPAGTAATWATRGWSMPARPLTPATRAILTNRETARAASPSGPPIAILCAIASLRLCVEN